MEVIFVLIILSLLLAAGFLIAFFWAIRSGQYDDSYTPSIRVLFDDGTKKKKDLDKSKLKENKTLDQ
jgi:cbb3-type cytochrome oxidase maturation protein